MMTPDVTCMDVPGQMSRAGGTLPDLSQRGTLPHLSGGGTPPCDLPPPPPHEQTDAFEKITFPQMYLRAVKIPKFDDQTSTFPRFFFTIYHYLNSFKRIDQFTFTRVTQGAYVVQQTHFRAAGIITRINNCICCSFPVPLCSCLKVAPTHFCLEVYTL